MIGTWTLVRFVLRRDRLVLTLWTRVTRAPEEERGRTESLGATAIGRFAPTTAAVAVVAAGRARWRSAPPSARRASCSPASRA